MGGLLGSTTHTYTYTQRIYLCRRTVGKVQKKRVPASPVGMPGSWLSTISPVSDDEFLRMAGLDAYMMMRFIKVCIRVTALYVVVYAYI